MVLSFYFDWDYPKRLSKLDVEALASPHRTTVSVY